MKRPALLAAAALALAGCGANETATPQLRSPSLPAAVAEIREVDTAVSADAVVEAVRQSTVASQISGRIIDLPFDVGDTVRKGQVIARIDERAAAQALVGAEAQANAAEAALGNARAVYERSRSLFAQGFISQSALDKAQADFRAAESQMKATLAGTGQAQTERSLATIAAPYGGVVSARHVQLGEMATPGKAIMTGFDPTSLRVVATVASVQVGAIQSAGRVRVEVPAAQRWIEARSFSVLPAADPRTHVTQIRVELPEDVKGVFPGMFARAHFSVGRDARLMIPREAIVRRSELTAVYVLPASGPPQLRQVRLGPVTDASGVEILAGLRPGERVALYPVRAASATAS